MGITSSLFYNSNNSDEPTLYRRIVTTDEQYDEQRERWNNLADHIMTSLNEKTGYPISSWLQGSYKFGTQIRPIGNVKEFDIDLGIYFQWEGKATEGKHTPKELRNYTQAALEEYKDANSDDVIEVVNPPKARCCRIRFNGDFHIDIPVYHLNSKFDKRMLATDAEWEISDPKEIYIWFKNEFEDDYHRSKIRRFIQYVKCWAALKFEDEERPSSILLTVLVAQACKKLSDTEIAADDEALSLILNKMVESLDKSTEVLNPVNQSEDLSKRLTDDSLENFLTKLKNFKAIANEALSCDVKLEAANKWSEAFDCYFPMPEQEDLSKSTKGSLVTYIPLSISVKAIPRNNIIHKEFKDINKIGAIPKNCDIYFEITNSEAIPQHSIIQWIVRNEGEEANYVNDMGHIIANGGIRTQEHSAYRGTHYMDCIVKQYGRIIAYQRVPVTISDISMPKRNPVLRPYYAKLRSYKRYF